MSALACYGTTRKEQWEFSLRGLLADKRLSNGLPLALGARVAAIALFLTSAYLNGNIPKFANFDRPMFRWSAMRAPYTADQFRAPLFFCCRYRRKASISARNMLTAADNFLQKQQEQRRRQLLPASSARRRAKELEHGRLLARFSTVRAR